VNKRIERDLGISNFIRWRTGRVRIDYKENWDFCESKVNHTNESRLKEK
jgi:hypothetical protein